MNSKNLAAVAFSAAILTTGCEPDNSADYETMQCSPAVIDSVSAIREQVSDFNGKSIYKGDLYISNDGNLEPEELAGERGIFALPELSSLLGENAAFTETRVSQPGNVLAGCAADGEKHVCAYTTAESFPSLDADVIFPGKADIVAVIDENNRLIIKVVNRNGDSPTIVKIDRDTCSGSVSGTGRDESFEVCEEDCREL